MCWPGAARRPAPSSTTPGALQIAERLTQTDPHHIDRQRNLWVSLYKIASVQEDLGVTTAIDHWTKAHHILAALDAAGKLPNSDRQFLHYVAANLARSSDTHSAAAFSSWLYRREVGFPGTCSFGMAPSGVPCLSYVGRLVPVGRQVYDRRLISGGRVSVRREASWHWVFRGCRGCRHSRISSAWRARHHVEAR